MRRLDYNEEFQKAIDKGMEQLKALDVDVKQDDWTIVQPFNDGQAIIISIGDDPEEPGERKLSVIVNDTTVTLPKLNATLTIFGRTNHEE